MDYFDEEMQVSNPYALQPANGAALETQAKYESGKSLAVISSDQAMKEVEVQAQMAQSFPRNPLVAMNNILRECERSTLAEKAVYSYPRGGETVSGPSIRLAETLARNWKNIYFDWYAERSKTADGQGFSTVRVFAWDLENNVRAQRSFTLLHIRETRNNKTRALTSDRDIYELEANFAMRRLRAVILQVIPGDVVEMAVQACKQTLSSGIKTNMQDEANRARYITKTVKVFEKMGITREHLESYLKAKVENWQADHMLRLKDLKNSLDDGVVTIGEIFPDLGEVGKDELITKEQVTTLMEASKASGMQSAISSELKKMGIAKYADVPARRYDEVMRMILGFGVPSSETPAQIEGNTTTAPESPQEAGK